MATQQDDTIVLSIDEETELMIWQYDPNDISLTHKAPVYSTPETIKTSSTKLANSISSSVRVLFNTSDDYVPVARPQFPYKAHPSTLIFPTPTLQHENQPQPSSRPPQSNEIRSPPPLFIPPQAHQSYRAAPTTPRKPNPIDARTLAPSPTHNHQHSHFQSDNSTPQPAATPIKTHLQPHTPIDRTKGTSPTPFSPFTPSVPNTPTLITTVQQSPLVPPIASTMHSAVAPPSLVSTTVSQFIHLEPYINSTVANMTLIAGKMDLLTKQANLLERRVEYNTTRLLGRSTIADRTDPEQECDNTTFITHLPDISNIMMLLELVNPKGLSDGDNLNGSTDHEDQLPGHYSSTTTANQSTRPIDPNQHSQPFNQNSDLEDDGDDHDGDVNQGVIEMYTGDLDEAVNIFHDDYDM